MGEVIQSITVTVKHHQTPTNMICNYSVKFVTAQIALYFAQEQGESAEFTCVNEHFQTVIGQNKE